MIENSMSKEELYNHLNFSKDQIAEDQNKEPYENIVVNEHVFLVDIISTYRNKFSHMFIPRETLFHRKFGPTKRRKKSLCNC